MESEERYIYADLVSGNSDDGAFFGSVKVYDGNTWYITTRLSDIPGAELTEVEDAETGEPRRGLFLPFNHSGLTVTPKKNVLLVCKAEMAQVASKRYTHLLTQIMDAVDIAHWRSLGFKQSFLGHMRPAQRKNNNFTKKR